MSFVTFRVSVHLRKRGLQHSAEGFLGLYPARLPGLQCSQGQLLRLFGASLLRLSQQPLGRICSDAVRHVIVCTSVGRRGRSSPRRSTVIRRARLLDDGSGSSGLWHRCISPHQRHERRALALTLRRLPRTGCIPWYDGPGVFPGLVLTSRRMRMNRNRRLCSNQHHASWSPIPSRVVSPLLGVGGILPQGRMLLHL